MKYSSATTPSFSLDAEEFAGTPTKRQSHARISFYL
jgi:hypothetical protein